MTVCTETLLTFWHHEVKRSHPTHLPTWQVVETFFVSLVFRPLLLAFVFVSCLRWCNGHCMIFHSNVPLARFNPAVSSIFSVFHHFSLDQHHIKVCAPPRPLEASLCYSLSGCLVAPALFVCLWIMDGGAAAAPAICGPEYEILAHSQIWPRRVIIFGRRGNTKWPLELAASITQHM